MAKYIDFPEEVGRYYSQVYRKNNPYADVLSSLVRSYSGANAEISALTTTAQQQARTTSQRSIADIHSAFEQGKRGISDAGFASSFSRVTGRTLESGQQDLIRQETQRSKSELPQAQYLDITQDPFYKAYIADTQSRIASTAGLAADLFGYLNTSDTMSDMEFALDQDYINADGEITEKGKYVMNRYTSQIETKDGVVTDKLVASKGTFKRYVQEKMGDKYDENLLAQSLGVFSEMTGTQLGEGKTLSTEERNKMFEGSDVKFADDAVDFNKDGYRTIKDKNAPDLSKVITTAEGTKYTLDEMIKLGLAEGMMATDKQGRVVYYHDGQWYLKRALALGSAKYPGVPSAH